MEDKPKMKNLGRISGILVLTLIASLLPEIIFRELTGSVPNGTPIARLIILFLAGILFQFLKQTVIAKYTVVLGVIVLSEVLTSWIFYASFWQDAFDRNTFVGNFGGSILLKAIGVVPVVGILLVFFKSPKTVYLTKGNLSAKADEIRWLSLKKDAICWGKLAVISAVLISLGTILLTVFTVTGSPTNIKIDVLLKYLPYVILFATLNSLCEGIVYRSAILGSLKDVLPKSQVVLVAALIFGIGHYYGAPSGIAGVMMSGLLGWYMSRSVVESKGLAASWMIHFMQDAVIFSTILLLGSYS